MDPKKIAELLGYAALIPNGISIVIAVAGQIKQLLDSGEEVLDERIEELCSQAVANHAALPTPEQIEQRD